MEYNVYHQVDSNVARAGLSTIDQGVVRAIPLLHDQEALSQTEAQEAISRLAALQEENSVVTNAGDLGTPWSEEDAGFGQMDTFDLTPEAPRPRWASRSLREKAGAGLLTGGRGWRRCSALDPGRQGPAGRRHVTDGNRKEGPGACAWGRRWPR